jgi:hypothetical protein
MPFVKLAYLIPLVLVVGCGNSMKPFQPGGSSGNDLTFTPIDGGGNSDLANGDAAADGGHVAQIDMAGFNLPGSPLVVIDAPMPTTEVQYDSLTVTATITSPSMTAIQSSSVQLTITPPNGGIVTVPLSLSNMANVYSGSIDISAIPSGMSTFSVSAVDTMNRKGSATGSYIHDHGPVITFLQPAAATAHNSVTVELLVDDPLHPVTDPTQVSAYIHAPGDITLKQEMGAIPMRLSALVDFSKFNPPLDGTQIINATAINPKGTTTHATKQFIVDNSGPVIVMTAMEGPQPGTFVGGVIEIKADVMDISGVSDVSVLAVFGNDATHNAVPLTRLSPGSNTFHGFFDVRSLGHSYVLPEFQITAADTLGNTSQLGEEIIVDNTTPWMTMNAKIKMRVSQPDLSGLHECTRLFSPLTYPETTGEGDTVLQIATLRARVEDHGNWAPGLLRERYSGVDPLTVTLYVIPDNAAGVVLAVDTDGDGVCDEVNPLLVPTSQVTASGQALALAMDPLNVSTNYDFTFVPSENPQSGGGTCTAGPGCPPTDCDYVGLSTAKAPPRMCIGTTMTAVIPFPNPGNTLPIYSIRAVTTADCVGLQLDSGNTLPEGPTCAIVRATDKAGNTMVSYPLHFCIDRGGGKCPSNWLSTIPSDCSGKWDKVAKKLLPGTCAEPTAQIADGVEPNPGTFPKLNEVRFLPDFTGAWAP